MILTAKWTTMLMALCVTIIALVSMTASLPSKRGACLLLCGDFNNVTCPSGYECQSNGCGSECFRTTFVQPEGCPLYKCAYNCPLGYVRDEQGCEACECDYTRLG